jgi:nicotinate phosphoribosyltransferase
VQHDAARRPGDPDPELDQALPQRGDLGAGAAGRLGMPEEQFYGYGGHVVAATAPGTLTRDRVAAVWKLSQTGGTPTMKFADDANRGKESVPGRLVLWRRMQGGGPTGIIGQEGEAAPAGYEAWGSAPADPKYTLEFSPETQALRTRLRRAR